MRQFREGLGLTMRDVHHLSKKIAKPLRNSDYVVSPSRLSDIESKGHTPNLYRLHALSVVYDCRVEKLLKFYGI
jgi:transcriptional regulator with XRE-family HTH domain